MIEPTDLAVSDSERLREIFEESTDQEISDEEIDKLLDIDGNGSALS